MNQQPEPHPDYESLQEDFDSIAQCIARYRYARAIHKEFMNCSAEEVAGIA